MANLQSFYNLDPMNPLFSGFKQPKVKQPEPAYEIPASLKPLFSGFKQSEIKDPEPVEHFGGFKTATNFWQHGIFFNFLIIPN